MCGIFGLIKLHGLLDHSRFDFSRATDVLSHRGPDDQGHYIDRKVYLGHRRLSIIDLCGGKQPIFNEDRSLCIVYNGEIYNFQEIRQNLLVKGHRFETNSDTETIVHAYEQWGEDCVSKLRGMFSFAIWDAKKQRLFCARDRLGEKPFFYALHKGILYFASEMKAILQYPDFPREIDPDGLVAYFSLGYIPWQMTIFRHIKKLLPGHTLDVKEGTIRIKKYWDLHFQPDRSKTERYFIDGFMGLLEEAVQMRLISEVPLGAFLSGGIDSGTVVALMSRHSPEPVKTCCIGFGGDVGGYHDERSYAREIADRYKTQHREYEVLPDVRSIIEEIVRAFDEPFADHSTIPSYYLSKVTRKKVTVALSGLGGDEIFGGYERYLGFKLSSCFKFLPSGIVKRIFAPIVESIPERADGHYTINHMKRFIRSAQLPAGERYLGFVSMSQSRSGQSIFSTPYKYKESHNFLRDSFLGYFNSDNASEPLDRVFYTDIKTYLPDDILACTDRMSMWHSLEVRVPFLDHRFMEFCATIPNNLKVRLWSKKHILKKATGHLLPESILNHRKQGFVGPMSRWLQTDLKNYAQEILHRKSLNVHGIFDIKTIQRIMDDHFSRRQIHDRLIWSLIIFQNWHNIYLLSNYKQTIWAPFT